MKDWMLCLNTFHTVARCGSFAGAARAMYTTPSAISKRIAWLEEHLENKLFERSTRQLRLTDAGLELRQRSQTILDHWDMLKYDLMDHQAELSGEIRVGIASTVLDTFITQRLSQFSQLHPKLRINVISISRPIYTLPDEMDIYFGGSSIQFHHPKRFHQSCIGSDRYRCYASPEYIERSGVPKTPKALIDHSCLFYNMWTHGCFWELNDVLYPIQPKLEANNMRALILAACEGAGILYCPEILKKDIAKNTLVHILKQYQSAERRIYMVWPKQKFTPKKVTELVDFIQNEV